jgi:hypothetical protein
MSAAPAPGVEFTVPQGMDYEGERAVLVRHIQDGGPSRWEAAVVKPGTGHDGERLAISDGYLEEALTADIQTGGALLSRLSG